MSLYLLHFGFSIVFLVLAIVMLLTGHYESGQFFMLFSLLQEVLSNQYRGRA